MSCAPRARRDTCFRFSSAEIISSVRIFPRFRKLTLHATGEATAFHAQYLFKSCVFRLLACIQVKRVLIAVFIAPVNAPCANLSNLLRASVKCYLGVFTHYVQTRYPILNHRSRSEFAGIPTCSINTWKLPIFMMPSDENLQIIESSQFTEM